MPRLATTFALAWLPISLVGCAGSSPAIDPRPVLELRDAQADSRLREGCRRPAPLTPDLPGGRVSAGAIERKIAHDAAALIACADRHEAATAFTAERDAGLAGE